MSEQIDKRTYKDILESFISELNERGAELEYKNLKEQERLELLQLLMDQCRKHMRPFMVHVLGYDWYWFHDIWYNNFLQYTINCNVASRGLGKSFFWSRTLLEYCTAFTNNFTTLLSSYNEEATFDFIKGNRQDFEFNELLSSKIPFSKAMDWNKSTLDLANNSSIKGISITSQIRGKHINFLNADDIMNDEQKLTPVQVKNKIFGTILPTLMRKRGRFNIIGTRFSEGDIYALFKEKAAEVDKYKYTELAVELDEKESKVYINYFDENGLVSRHLDTGVTDIYDFEDLLNLKILDPFQFAKEYECKVTSSDDVPFPLDVLMDCRDKELCYDLVADPKIIYKAGLDFSNSTSKDADETVLLIGYEDNDNNAVVANIFADNKLETPERMSMVKKRMDAFRRVDTLAEKNSMGLTNIHNLNKENYRLEPFHTERVKKVDLTDYASIMVKRRKVRFPYKTLKDQKITDKLIHQLAGVRPKVTRGGLPSFTGTTKHDDYYIGFILFLKHLSNANNGPTKIKGFTRDQLRWG